MFSSLNALNSFGPQLKMTRVILGRRIPFQLVANPIAFQEDLSFLRLLSRRLLGHRHIIPESAFIVFQGFFRLLILHFTECKTYTFCQIN